MKLIRGFAALHVIPDLLCAAVSSAASLVLAFLIFRSRWASISRLRRAVILSACALLIGLFVIGWLLNFHRVAYLFPSGLEHWTQAVAMFTGLLLTCISMIACLIAAIPPFRDDRRRVFRAARAAMLASPAVICGFGIIERTHFRVSEARLKIAGLPRDLSGIRIVQVTDMHLSPFLSERQLARVIDMANETKAHLALMTGDLITRPGDPLDACIRQVTRLRADAGVYGCLGNHEVYCEDQDYVTRECGRRGLKILRSERTEVPFGDAAINLAGVDYQPMGLPYLANTAPLVRPGRLNMLLSHNPDVFRVAREQGWNVVIAGHTHGGQVNVEILHRNLNVARFFTPWVLGTYYEQGAVIYVSSGIGTIGMPVRLGAPPEISVIELCAS